MKPSSVAVQTDLFNNAPAIPAFPSSHPRHDEIVTLLVKLMWEVQMPLDQSEIGGKNHDRD
jgi:hypothetical protein